MYSVHDKVIYKNYGVCEISEIKVENYGSGEKSYYVLKPVFSSALNQVMIPVNNCKQIRNLITYEDVNKVIEDMPNAKDVWINDSRIRKDTFIKIVNDGNISELCSLVRVLYFKKAEYNNLKKKIPFSDKTILETAERLVNEEIASVLNIDLNDVTDYIRKRLAALGKA